MKLVVEDKKKLWIYVAIIVLSVGGMIWVWFGAGMFGPAAPATTVPMAGITASKGDLPYGSSINLQLFSDARFKSLNAPVELKVTPEELGKDNPFKSTAPQ